MWRKVSPFTQAAPQIMLHIKWVGVRVVGVRWEENFQCISIGITNSNQPSNLQQLQPSCDLVFPDEWREAVEGERKYSQTDKHTCVFYFFYLVFSLKLLTDFFFLLFSRRCLNAFHSLLLLPISVEACQKTRYSVTYSQSVHQLSPQTCREHFTGRKTRHSDSSDALLIYAIGRKKISSKSIRIANNIFNLSAPEQRPSNNN